MDESSGTHIVAVELDLAVGVTLGVDASVSCTDQGTGSADSGSDYVAFGTQVVTFAGDSIWRALGVGLSKRAQQPPTQTQFFFSRTVRQKAVVTDADEAFGQHVQTDA